MAGIVEAEVAESAPRVLRLSGRVAVVTGSDSGIGQAIAETFALEGADIAITFHRDQEGAAHTARQVAASGRRSLIQRMDVREALAAPGPALVEATVDPHEPPMPQKATFKQMAHLAESLARGTPERGKIALTIASDTVRELV